jgi:hypothetical protein
MGVESGRCVGHIVGRSWSEGGSGKLRTSVKAVIPLLSLFALAACAIHPIQKDVTGVQTPDIVNHIRCETRIAIQKKAVDKLRKYNDQNYSPGSYKFEHNKYLADTLEQHISERWNNIVNPRRDLDAKELAFYNRYIQTGIAFDFTFGSTEDDSATLTADPVRLITNGMAGINFGSTGDFNRDNSRKFTVTETFDKLLFKEDIKNCTRDLGAQNYAYPVAGVIGIDELISTFIDLNEDENLTKAAGASDVFGDTLTFTTTLSGSVTPVVQITPVGRKYGFSPGTGFAASAKRTDRHMLGIGLSMSSEKPAAPAAGAKQGIAASAYQSQSALQKTSGLTDTELRALAILTQLRLDAFLDRAAIISIQ